MLKAVIIDDEPRAREVLRNFLLTFCKEVQLMAEAANVPLGIQAIQQYQPDLVFLDVEMPRKNGFDLLTHFPNPTFEVIFTTAHKDYVIQAIRASAIDYLLKPVDLDELLKAIARVVQKVETKNRQQNRELIELLQQNLAANKGVQKLALPSADRMLFVKKEDVIYLEAERSYTRVITDHKRSLVAKPLRFFDQILTDEYFFRPHRSYLINLKRVDGFVRKDGSYIEMDNGDKVKLAHHLKDDFLSIALRFS